MRSFLGCWLAAGLGCGLILPTAVAAEGAGQPPAASGGIVGQDVMGDKNRSGPDGFSWAPTTRDQASSGKAPGETAQTAKQAENAKPGGGAGKSLSAGDDPGTPVATDAAGPGTADQATPRR